MSMYQNFNQKSNKYLAYAIILVVFLIGLGTGFLIKNNKPSQIIIDKNMKIGLPAQINNTSAPAGLPMGNFLASINGTAYYPKDCAAANRIKEENRIWFDTKKEAEIQGYRPAQNCAW